MMSEQPAANFVDQRKENARTLPKPLAALLIVLVIGILFSLYLHLSNTVPANSDDASPVVAAYAAVHGNPLLRGWNLATVNYYTTDLLWYDLGAAAFGLSPRLMHLVPAAIFTGIVALGVCLAWRRRLSQPWLAVGITFALLGLPSLGLTQFVLMGPLHMGAVFWMLLALLLLDGPLTPRRTLALGALLTLALFGDAITLWTLALPLLVVCSWNWVQTREPEGRREEARAIGATVIAIVLAKIGLIGVRILHGFDTTGVGQGFATFDGLGHNLGLLTWGLFSLFGADYFGRILNLGSLLLLLHIAGFVLVAAAVRQAIVRAPLPASDEPPARRVNQILAVALLIAVAAFFISSNAHGTDTVRFLAPAYIFGAILAGRISPRLLPHTRPVHYTCAVLGVVYLVTFAWNLRAAARPVAQGVYNGLPPASGPTNDLEAFLASRGLTSGYGPYWSANIVTLDTRGAVQVRAVQGVDGQVAIDHWWSDNVHWYHHVPANFVVVDTHGDGNFSAADAAHTFGPPAAITPVGHYLVLTWPRDISDALASSPSGAD